MPPGKVLTSTLIDGLKVNVSRVLENYVGVMAIHYRRVSLEPDIYCDLTGSDFNALGVHLLSLSSHDYDMLQKLATVPGEVIHFETEIPIQVFLDPEVEWREHDEVIIEIDTEESLFSKRFELTGVQSANRAGVTVYRTANLAPVREART